MATRNPFLFLVLWASPFAKCGGGTILRTVHLRTTLHQHRLVRRQEPLQVLDGTERLAGERSPERRNNRPVRNQQPSDVPDLDESSGVAQLPKLAFDECRHEIGRASG